MRQGKSTIATITNLYDTNGRRSDVLTAYGQYCNILLGMSSEWASWPASTAQFDFYGSALACAPNIFTRHPHYDEFVRWLSADASRKGRFEACDATLDVDTGELDAYIEARARHYTSTLVRIGFATGDRKVTEVGRQFVDNSKVTLDRIEGDALGLTPQNAILLRQLLKLRVWTRDGRAWFSPFAFVVRQLLRHESIPAATLFRLAVAVSPSFPDEDVDALADEAIKSGFAVADGRYAARRFGIATDAIDALPAPMARDDFDRFFGNRKSSQATDAYYAFYVAATAFARKHDAATLAELRKACEGSNRSLVNKAFGENQVVLNTRGKMDVDSFVAKNEGNPLVSEGVRNSDFLVAFAASKRSDLAREYANTLMTLACATGVASIDGGVATLPHRFLWEAMRDVRPEAFDVFGDAADGGPEAWEEAAASPFVTPISLTQVLGLDGPDVDGVIDRITAEFGSYDGMREAVRKAQATRCRKTLARFPLGRLLDILAMFDDRKANDGRIRKQVSPAADCPTIYEWLVGALAWHFLGCPDDPLPFFRNMSLDADFLPLNHAGGGHGDVEVDAEVDGRLVKVLFEATIMDSSSQKEGEDEPVRRHSANLAIESGRPCVTFFVAPTLNANTVSDWELWGETRRPYLHSNQAKWGSACSRGLDITPLTSARFAGMLRDGVRFADWSRGHSLHEVEVPADAD